jgi:SAM-dependent methyltransferase
MSSDFTAPVSPALQHAALLNLGWRPDQVVIDASSGELPSAPPDPTSSAPPVSSTASSETVLPDTAAASNTVPPAPAAPVVWADWITFFGPFIHLADVEIFRRLEAAKRLLKPDGRIVFSFLEYDVPHHWQLFRQSAGQPVSPQPAPLHFLNRATIESWVLHLGLNLECHYSGEVRWLQPLQSGAVVARSFGQSVAVLAPVAEAE